MRHTWGRAATTDGPPGVTHVDEHQSRRKKGETPTRKKKQNSKLGRGFPGRVRVRTVHPTAHRHTPTGGKPIAGDATLHSQQAATTHRCARTPSMVTYRWGLAHRDGFSSSQIASKSCSVARGPTPPAQPNRSHNERREGGARGGGRREQRRTASPPIRSPASPMGSIPPMQEKNRERRRVQQDRHKRRHSVHTHTHTQTHKGRL